MDSGYRYSRRLSGLGSTRFGFLAIADLAGVVAGFRPRSIETSDAPVEVRGDGDLEPARERLPFEIEVASDVAAHRILGLAVDFGFEDPFFRDHTVQEPHRTV